MRELEELFKSLGKSAFRNKFHLQGKDLDYLRNKGMATVLAHAHDFIAKRLAPALPEKDGKQTPFRGHPAFVAQHATACCCRGCLEKWHRIPRGRPLSADEENYILSVLERWFMEELRRSEIGPL
ncbi:MAG: DUF4186 domain-containing protein [Gammaproteobacteria bacterium]